MNKNILHEWLKRNKNIFHPVVSFNPEHEKIIHVDSSQNNKALNNIDFTNTILLSEYINNLLKQSGAKYGIGGYNEKRPMYSRSKLFNNDINTNSSNEEPRRLHIGVDISGKEGTEIFAPCDATVHSFAFNNNFGDYGATIILKHVFYEISFYTLYGHLSFADLQQIHEGDFIKAGQLFAHFGSVEENGNWPPHLHFQIIHDIENYKGDYPGVCKISERKKYLGNCPDPNLILKMM